MSNNKSKLDLDEILITLKAAGTYEAKHKAKAQVKDLIKELIDGCQVEVYLNGVGRTEVDLEQLRKEVDSL